MLLSLLAFGQALAGTMLVEVIDVGQGDGILITSPAGKTVLIDGGTGRKTNMVTELLGREIESVDLVIGTHNHADHIGGLDEVLAALPVSIYLDQGLPHTTATYEKVMDLVESRGIPYKVARHGQVFKLDDGIRLELLLPEEPLLQGTRSDLNSNSVVARLTHGDNCFLLTGDAELETEHRILEQEPEPCDVLKVAHHGSAYATSKRFLAAIQPRMAVVSVGANNRYKHPSPQTMDRVRAAGATVFRTDKSGTVRFVSDGKDIEVIVESWPRPKLPPGVTVAPAPFVPDGGAPPPPSATAIAAAPPPPPMETAPPPAPPPPPAPVAAPPVAPELAGASPAAQRRLARKKRRRMRRLARLGGVPAPVAPPAPEAPAPAPAAAPKPAPPPASSKVDINQATVAQLVAVPGIGPAKATAIVHHRETSGPFTSMEQLDDVPGIGPATLDALRKGFEVRSSSSP